MTERPFDSLRDRLLEQGRPSLVPRELDRGVTEMSSMLRLRPFAEAMFLVVAADGQVETHEQDVLRGVLRVLTEGRLGGRALDAMLEDFRRSLEHDGLDVRLDRIAESIYGDREDAELLVSLGVAAALADGQVQSAEGDVIHRLAERLRVPMAPFMRLLEPARAR